MTKGRVCARQGGRANSALTASTWRARGEKDLESQRRKGPRELEAKRTWRARDEKDLES